MRIFPNLLRPERRTVIQYCIRFVGGDYLLALVRTDRMLSNKELACHVRVLRPRYDIRFRKTIFPFYVALLIVGLFVTYTNVGTLSPSVAFHRTFLATSGVEREAGSFMFALVHQPALWFMFMVALYLALVNQKSQVLAAFLVGSAAYYGFFTGSKSGVILPFVYWMWVFLIVKSMPWSQTSAIPRRFMSDKQAILTLTLLIALTIAVGYLLVALNELRSGYSSDSDFLEKFLFRVDYISTLSGYLDRHDDFVSQWPPLELFTNFIPGVVADDIGLNKSRLSFDVVYTQFAHNTYRLSSSASVGLAAINETLRPIGLDIPILAAVVAGWIAALLTDHFSRMMMMGQPSRRIFWVAAVVPQLHIVGFFEPGPTLLFKISFSLIVILAGVMPVLVATSSVKLTKMRSGIRGLTRE